MTNLISNIETKSFNDVPKIMFHKKFINVPQNTIAKYPALLIKVGEKIYAMENVTLISKISIIDIISTKPIQDTENFLNDKTNKIKSIKKINKSLNSKFQIGLSQNELELLYDSKDALAKYKLLKKFNLKIKEGEHG